MERFAKIVNDLKSLAILSKRSILGVWQGSEYASVWGANINENFGDRVKISRKYSFYFWEYYYKHQSLNYYKVKRTSSNFYFPNI